MKYTNYGTDMVVRILVSAGGLENGNACAFIEYTEEEPDEIWYVEYGNNPIRKLVGTCGIEWLDDDEFEIIKSPEYHTDSETDDDTDDAFIDPQAIAYRYIFDYDTIGEEYNKNMELYYLFQIFRNDDDSD